MRVFVAIAIIFVAVSPALAQKQEQKLIDRLLRPNMAMKNSAQDKKFTNGVVASFNKPARTKSFYAPATKISATYPDERVFTPRQFAARHFRGGDSAANVAARSQLTRHDTVIETPAAPGVRGAPETVQSTAATKDFSGNRPFLVEGKSQKALRAHDRPLTIEQVRELLNKSK
ncbi:MAG TPA: hypothetical protein VM940_01860 [Chthoniobacterales bacterium]|nr:hypothetical protein [Chthoniobacterales bacterium]